MLLTSYIEVSLDVVIVTIVGTDVKRAVCDFLSFRRQLVGQEMTQ